MQLVIRSNNDLKLTSNKCEEQSNCHVVPFIGHYIWGAEFVRFLIYVEEVWGRKTFLHYYNIFHRHIYLWQINLFQKDVLERRIVSSGNCFSQCIRGLETRIRRGLFFQWKIDEESKPTVQRDIIIDDNWVGQKRAAKKRVSQQLR